MSIRTTFYYERVGESHEVIGAVKHCLRPQSTKVWKQLQRGLDTDKYRRIGWRRSEGHTQWKNSTSILKIR